MNEDHKVSQSELIEQYREYVHAVARKLSLAMALPQEEDEELISAGYIGLIEAAGRYDPTQRSTFKQFAFLRIRGAMIDNLRKNSDLSGTAYRFARALQATENTREEVFSSGSEGSSADRLAKLMEYAARGALAYRMVCESSQEVEELVQSSDRPDHLTEKKEEFRRIRHLVSMLPEKEKLIVEQYYLEDRSFVEIAEASDGMSKSWVSRLHSRALGRLKQLYLEQEEEAHVG